jgi:Bacterial Ig-like domain (group 3)/Beta-propeller repeat
MKRACFRLFQLLTTTFLLSQSNPVPVINQTASTAPPASAVQPDPKAQARILDQYGKLPLSFEANQGQADARVKFLSRTGGYSLFLTADEAVLALRAKREKKGEDTVSTARPERSRRVLLSTTKTRALAPERTTSILHMKLRNANSAAQVSAMDELAGTSNYFIGSDPAKWQANVPTYAKVKYVGIYSGIDLVYYGNQRQLEYDFIVAPGADPSRIAFDVSGAKRIRQDACGELVFKMGEDEIRWKAPVAYQEKNGALQLVAARYAVTDPNRVTFDLAKYDASRPLYIDPLIYSTYLGGSGNDQGNGIAVDSAGNAYVTGYTESTDFPTQSPFQSSNGGSTTAFVTKINAAGSALVYSTYLGGSGGDIGYGIVVDKAGNAYVVGQTASTDFPTKNPLQPSLGGAADAFVVKLNPTGSALVYSTYLGGSGAEFGLGIALDGAGNAYVTGTTASTNFPVTAGAFQTSCAGSSCGDAFVSKLNSKGSALIYSTYLGGSGEDVGQSIAVDAGDHAYVTGYTSSTDFPTKNPLQASYSGKYDIFVTKFNPKGSSLIYSTYLGGPENDFGNGIAADTKGNAYVTGVNYTNFCNRVSCYYNAFVTEINPTGSAFVYDVGSDTNYSAGNGIAVDSSGNAYMIGAIGGDSETPVYTTFVEKFDPSGSAVGSPTYLRGGSGSFGYGIATDGLDNAYVTGTTRSTNFPTKSPLQPAIAGGYDAFVAKIDMRIVTETTLTSSPNPSTQGQAVTFTASVTSSNGAPPDGETISFMKGKTVLGTGSLSGGSASFTTSTLLVGTNVVTAVYVGDSNFAGSTSKAVKQVVNEAAMPDLVSQNPSASLTQTPEPTKSKSQYHQPPCPSTTKVFDYYGPTYVTQPVTVDSQSNMDIYCHDVYNVICDGVVSFYDWVDGRKSLLGTGSPINGDGCGRMFVTTSLSVGTHVIEATYEDSTGIYGPSSGRTTVEVTTWPTTTALTSSPDPSNYGQDVTFTVAPTSQIEDPQTGKVTIFNGTIPLGTAALNANGVATFIVKNLPVGTNPITAEYLGDSLSAKSTSPVLNQVVNPASTVTGLTSSANPSSPGETVTFTAGVVSSTGAIPTGTVTFAAGGTTLGTVALTGRTAKISTATLPAGSTTITATYNSSTDFTGSSASLTQSVRQ